MSHMEDPDKRWGYAIEEWLSGRPNLVTEEIASLAAPDFVREFLTDLALKRVKRTQGRPLKYKGEVERALACAVFAEWDRLKDLNESNPKLTAIAIVAERNKMKEDELRGIMEKMKPSGWTLDFWRSRIKPARM